MKKGYVQLTYQSLSLICGFVVWGLISSLLPYIKEDIPLTSTQTAWVTAIPVLLGSALRVPVGYLTNRFGARTLFTVSFGLLLLPALYLSRAHSPADLLISGLFIGLSGALFSVGVTSLPKYFPKERHGFINGLYGMGNIGTAITSFSAPAAAKIFGWSAIVQFSMVLLAAFACLSFFIGDKHEPAVATPMMAQIKGVYRNQKLWLLSLFYFVTFGSFVAFTVYLPSFLVAHFGLDKVDAGLRTAGFIALATLVRPLGGWLADRFNAFKVLMSVFCGFTAAGVILSFSLSIGLYTFGCLLVALCAGLGNGTVFKLVPLYFSKQAGIVNGIVSAFGGIGGFFPPLVLTFVNNVTGHYAIGFMSLSEFALASFILTGFLYYQDRLQLAHNIMENTAEGLLVTDTNGIIRMINPAFTKVTGFTADDVIGKTPGILKSGLQDKNFYDDMWDALRRDGFWQGEIRNKRKNGEIFVEWLTISAVRNDAGEVKFYAGMFSDISNLTDSRG